MTKRFKRSAETVRARAQQSGGDYDSYLASDVKTFKPKEGENTIRIMPPTWNLKDWGDNWGIEVWVHNNIGADNASYLCLNKMKGEDCPLCNARAELDGEEASALKPKKRILTWVIDRDNEKAGPLVWNLGWQMEKDIQVRCLGKDGEVIQIDDPEEGFDIDFTREGTKLNTKYLGVQIARKASYLSEDEKRQDNFLAYTEDNPLPELLVYHDAEYIEKVYMGRYKEKDKDEERGDRRGGRRGRDSEPEPEQEERQGRRGRRGQEEEPEPEQERSGRRGRRGEEEPEPEDRPHRRGRSEEAEPEPEERGRGRRGREEAEPDPEDRPRRRGRSEEQEPEPEERGRGARRSGGRRGEQEEEPDEIPSERGGRRSRQAESEGDDDVKKARDKVNSLKGESGRGGGQSRRGGR